MSNNVLTAPTTSPDSRQRILDSARKELVTHGILGLRVADVARGADTSITLIYRYFGDRDGLLAQVLGDMYYEFFHPYTKLVDHLRNPETTLTLDELVNAMPLPDNPAAHDRRWMRVQILAAAANNEALRERIALVTRDYHTAIQEIIDLSRIKIGFSDPLPSKVYALILSVFNTMFLYNDMLGDNAVSNTEYQTFMHDFFSKFVIGNGKS
jgi:AcrR family transcriptional regulator